MKPKHILTAALLLICSFSFSQYKFEITVTNPGNEDLKSIYSKICKNIDFTTRRVEGERLIFESDNKYTEEKMENIVALAEYELILFKISTVISESNNDKK